MAATFPDLARRPYRPRHLRFLRREAWDDWRIKVYGIATFGKEARPALVDTAVGLAKEAFPRPGIAEDRYGTGFVIAHDAAAIAIALVYWWQSQNELHQRVFTGPHETPTALRPYADPAAGCVWELGIIDFERRAWLEDVLMNPAGPNIERYLSRQLEADV